MKRAYFALIAALLWISMPAAMHSQPKGDKPLGKTLLLDTVLHVSSDGIVRTRSLYYYNEKNYRIEVLNQKLDSSIWKNDTRLNSFYDNLGYKVADRNQYYVYPEGPDSWINQDSTFYRNDSKGQVIEKIDYVWGWPGVGSTTWILSARITKEYDQDGRLIVYTTYRLDSNVWVNSMRYCYGYYSYKHKYYSLWQIWDQKKNVWVDRSCSYTTYDSYGNEEYFGSCYSEADTVRRGVTECRHQNKYKDGNLVEYTLEQSINGLWIPLSKYLLKYNACGNMSEKIFVEYVDTSWIYKTKYLWGYDKWGNINVYITQAYQNDKWQNANKYNYLYNEYGLLLEYSDCRWLDSVWSNPNKIVCKYREASDNSKPAVADDPFPCRIMPNPASETARIEFTAKEILPVEARVYDLTGNLINNYHFAGGCPSGSISMDCRGFASGVYYVNVSSGSHFRLLPIVISR